MRRPTSRLALALLLLIVRHLGAQPARPDTGRFESEIRAFCHLHGAEVGAGSIIGPYARLRPGTRRMCSMTRCAVITAAGAISGVR